MDVHLVDLASALSCLPQLTELKLRSLNLVTDAGVGALAAVSQLQRLKLYALGDGVTEMGVAHVAGALPRLAELKVKDCWRVGPALRDAVAACRSALLQAGGAGGGGPGGAEPSTVVVVRCGTLECAGCRPPVAT